MFNCPTNAITATSYTIQNSSTVTDLKNKIKNSPQNKAKELTQQKEKGLWMLPGAPKARLALAAAVQQTHTATPPWPSRIPPAPAAPSVCPARAQQHGVPRDLRAPMAASSSLKSSPGSPHPSCCLCSTAWCLSAVFLLFIYFHAALSLLEIYRYFTNTSGVWYLHGNRLALEEDGLRATHGPGVEESWGSCSTGTGAVPHGEQGTAGTGDASQCSPRKASTA